MTLRPLCAGLAVLLAGCTAARPLAGQSFDPIHFFIGHTSGQARLRTLFGSSRSVAVDSRGVGDGRGGLMLEQTIGEQGEAPRVRRWTLHPVGAGRWAGTLTDAAGPVLVEQTPTDVTIRYRMRGGGRVEQHLAQRSAGRVDNRLTFSRFGIRLATLDEQIRKDIR